MRRNRYPTRRINWSATNLLLQGIFMAVAIAVGKIFFPEPRRRCTDDPSITHRGIELDPCSCFSETYVEAREKFRLAGKSIPNSKSFVLDVFQNYTTDVLYIPGNSQDVIVHTSGVHGVEGYAGSAIQVAFLQYYQKSLSKNEKNLPSLLFYHAVNPYGMAHYRRFNEENVDLNRNGMDDFDEVMKRDPNLANYVDFDAQFNPTAKFPYGFFVELIPSLLRHGLVKLKKALVTGQYHKPQGIFFGGQSMQASNSKMRDFYRDEFPTVHNRTVGKTTWINVHTGLGPFGIDTILSLPLNDPKHTRALGKVFNESLIPGLARAGDDVQAGYDLIQGTTEEMMGALLGSSDDWIVTQEFGTMHPILVARAMILENFMHHYSTSSREEGAELMKNAFYPRTTTWRREVLTRGVSVIEQGMKR